MAEVILPANPVDDVEESVPPEDRVVDDDLVLQRYNSQLPPSYRGALDVERKLLIRALRILVDDITASPSESSESDASSEDSCDEYVSEGYQYETERDFASLEKGISRYLDLKHPLQTSEYPLFFNVLLRGALTPSLDIGLRSKLARCASRLLSKRQCELPDGAPWRRIIDQITSVHIDCVDGTPVIGRDVREAHSRNFVSLLSKCRMYLSPDDDAETIWKHFAPSIRAVHPDVQFHGMILLSYVLPTQGDAWSGWVTEGMQLWGRMESSTDWDTLWMGLFSRLSRHQPCMHDWTPYLPWIYSRIEDASQLPLGALAPQGSIDRRCPQYLNFLMDGSVISAAARLSVYALSPKYPDALLYLKRYFALIANYFHPSNMGRWSGTIGSFLSYVTGALVSRFTDERHATEAGHMDRVLGDKERKGVAPAEHRLSEEYIDDLMDMLLPLIELGLHSKSHTMSVQSAMSARDLAIIRPDSVIPPLLQKASEGLESISSPHRTTAALRLLATLTPVFLDPDMFPEGAQYLQPALQLTLPGIDPNDPGKTEATLRFIAGSSARLQGMVNSDRMHISEDFFDDYMQQFLDRIFSLLDSLEAPPKKNPSGGYNGSQSLSFSIFSIAVENLFITLPQTVAISAARKVVKQLTAAACTNGMKFYGALVRVAASVASTAMNSSPVEMFIPPLVNQLLEDTDTTTNGLSVALVSVGEDELVWRIRMLAQACRVCGDGIEPYLEKISCIVQLAFERSERKIYKSGGRLLRGVLEGLTSIQMKFDVGSKNEKELNDSSNGDIYKFTWGVPSEKNWSLAESFLVEFVDRCERICPISENSDIDLIVSNRDLLFRVLRMLHAAQRGGRWLLGGALPKHLSVLEKYVDEDIKMSKKDAKLVLKRPVAAGLGGERDGGKGGQFATKIWKKIYSLALKLLSLIMVKRPDDGALLYRCLEPLELAHEPFRRGGQSRNTVDTSRSFKTAYKPVIAAKRPFGSEGGVGRAMPRFIIKLRIEAHHEMRLSAGARGGIDAIELCEDIVEKLTEVSLNDFPRVRGEARGVLTRAMRIVRPETRRREICRIISVLTTATSEGKSAETSAKDCAGDAVMVDAKDTNSISTAQAVGVHKSVKNEVLYEKVIGSSSVLRSSAVAPLIMRDTHLFSKAMHAILQAMPRAERPDAAGALGALFGKLVSLVRPLGIDPIRLVGSDLVTVSSLKLNSAEEKGKHLRLKAYNELNDYLLSSVDLDDQHKKNPNGSKALEDLLSTGEAHWKVQSLVAILLLILVRDDLNPSPKVAEFFMRGVVSDVVALRQICTRGVALIMALHGRKAGVSHEDGDNFDDSPSAWAKGGNNAIAAMGRISCSKDFARDIVHTLALDHDEDDREGVSRLGSLFAMLHYSRVDDGESCWTRLGGRPWPTSWTPRSRDSLSLLRVRFYEGLVRVFGKSMLDAMLPSANELLKKLENKEERIIKGVKDEDVRVLVAELLAGICRGLDLYHCSDNTIEMDLFQLMKMLLNDLSGPIGNINGASTIRLIGTAENFAVGGRVMRRILDWQLENHPLIVPMGSGPHAHLQARRLRYIHSCLADIDDEEDERLCLVMKSSVECLVGEVGFNHGLKTVREEVGRLLSLLAINVSPSLETTFKDAILGMTNRLASIENPVMNGEKDMETCGGEAMRKKDEVRKSRSRQGETLSRFVSIVYWNGRAREFEPYIAEVIPSLFRSFDESDPERISHTRMALSLVAQGMFNHETIDKVIAASKETVQDQRWKVRGSVVGFLQIFSFCSLFTASDAELSSVRKIVMSLLSDSQLEVRQAGAAAFVTMIRDASKDVVDEVRSAYLKVLSETTTRRRGGKRPSLEGEKLFKRHGAVLALSSMVTSSPYSVPEWMPSVLVALSGCVNDPPPISTGVRELFGDFMRTHRDEWQTHKLAFKPDELDVVSELLVSPSYYA